jgi:hypothetical protein
MATGFGPDFSSVEGPEFVERVVRAEGVVQKLARSKWDFGAVPELFARRASCDVAAKEIVSVFDGRVQTRFGRLVMKGAGGSVFNLMSPESPRAIHVQGRPKAFDQVNRQVGSKGLADLDEFDGMRPLQRVDLYNPEVFRQPRDMVFWSALHGCGLFPTGFEDLSKRMRTGDVVRNLLFAPAVRKGDDDPLFMEAYSTVRFPTKVVEWMPKPLYGGMSPDTLHVDTLLTTEPEDVAHPYLDLVAEGRVKLGDRPYHMRRFAGISPKDATRGPKVPPEGARR